MNKLLLSKHNREIEFEIKIPNGDNKIPRDVHISIEFSRIGEIDTIGEKFYAGKFIYSRFIVDI